MIGQWLMYAPTQQIVVQAVACHLLAWVTPRASSALSSAPSAITRRGQGFRATRSRATSCSISHHVGAVRSGGGAVLPAGSHHQPGRTCPHRLDPSGGLGRHRQAGAPLQGGDRGGLRLAAVVMVHRRTCAQHPFGLLHHSTGLSAGRCCWACPFRSARPNCAPSLGSMGRA